MAAVRPVTIGYSEEERPLVAWTRAGVAAGPRVLVVAGQHGDEPLAVEAACAFVEDLRRSPAGGSIAAVACLNPDGRARRTRANARGRDLNRDHALLQSREVCALHRFVRRWRPHLVLDVHTYPPRRKRLLRHGLVYCHDVFLDVPTSPSHSLGEPLLLQMLRGVGERLRDVGVHADRYTLLSGRGRVRHSTPDVCDLRNGLALRYGTPTLLVEGRQPARGDGAAAADRTREALRTAIRAALDWAEAHAGVLATRSPVPQPGDPVPIRSRYQKSADPRRMVFADAAGCVREVELPGRYTPHLRTTATAVLPAAYAVPVVCERVIRALQRHGLESTEAVVEGGCGWRVQHVAHSRRSGRAPRRLAVEPVPAAPARCRVFPTAQRGGAALAVWLEPQSKYALHRFPGLGLQLQAGAGYPVRRLHARSAAEAERGVAARG